MLQTLETRNLFSAVLLDGILRIDGTDNNDLIAFERYGDGGTFRVHINGDIEHYDTDPVKRIVVTGGLGDDAIIAGQINIPVKFYGDAGDDSLSGGNGRDTIDGGLGNDYVYGRRGNDRLAGAAGYDTVMGGNGNDLITPDSDGHGDDVISGGNGNDTIDYGDYTGDLELVIGGNVPANEVSDDLLRDVEIVRTGSGDDRIVNATGRAIRIESGAGNDTIISGDAADIIFGGDGDDEAHVFVDVLTQEVEAIQFV